MTVAASALGQRGLYIDGKWLQGTESGGLLEVLDPATEETIAVVPEGGVAEVEAAVDAARNAFDLGPWGRMGPKDRAPILQDLYQAFVARTDDIVELAIAEAGATQAVAAGLQTAVPLAHFGDMVERVLRTFPFEVGMPPTVGAGVGQGVVVREPAGVVAAVTPFNYPFFVNLSKLGPALAAGCTVVLRPSPLTPLAALLIAEIVDEVGLPPGVVNVVTGDLEASRLLTSHPGVDVVTFTGSETTGQAIMVQAAVGLKRVVLELGGKSANVIFEDAPVERAAVHAVRDFTRHSGQGCACFTRILVHADLHDAVVERMVAELRSLRVGDPRRADTDMGPLIRESQRERVEGFVRSGVQEGATLAFGGGRPAGLDRGYFLDPSLFVDVKSSMTIAQEEVFGPVAVVIPFEDEEDAIRIANDSRFGLSGSVWSADTTRGYEVARRIRTGTVFVNGPAGGTNAHGPFGGYKHSGIGREFGEAGLGEYLETKSIKWPVG